MTFYWLPLRRQVRIEGVASKLSREASEEYFHQRPRASQVRNQFFFAKYFYPYYPNVCNRLVQLQVHKAKPYQAVTIWIKSKKRSKKN